MELKDIVGSHILDAVDFSTELIKKYDDEFIDCNAIRFRLDDVVYSAIENPDDGYRSSMKDILIIGYATMENSFQPQRVVCVHREGCHFHNDDILEIIDCETGLVVVEVGTTDTDDYYPCFVASFHPENMAINRDKEQQP